MPKRTDIKRILIIGSGPIIIGQACEFDYSGSQACKALKEEGYEIVLVNSNPATIMTDPEMADRTYIEPLTPETLEYIIKEERPDALLPTLGGQTGLNIAFALAKKGVLEKYKVELIGAKAEAIEKAESRELFKKAMENIGLKVPKSAIVHSVSQAEKVVKEIGFPVIIRPSFTLGGTGGGVAYNIEELRDIVEMGLEMSLIHQVMLEESVIGWKEFELEVMRDFKDNVVIICSIENFDPMGVHTGDSITVAPAQTLSDKEYQRMRTAAQAIIREIGVETGGSNIQFAINPKNGDMVVIEMNPRVSRSSALASKATGYPIAKIAAKLAVGYTLDELPNDITKETKAAFEPTIDYVVVKIPRFTFEKFPECPDEITTSMRSVGETMAIGRTFKEALQKAIRGLEIGRFGFGADGKSPSDQGIILPKDLIREKLVRPNSQRLFYIKEAFKAGFTIEEIYNLTYIDPWFLYHLKEIFDKSEALKGKSLKEISEEEMRELKQMGFSDYQIAFLTGTTEFEVREYRKSLGIKPTFKLIDTCAAEFEAYTPYYYSSWEVENESRVSKNRKILIIGGGPNRIGQGIEFDYCCVHASLALKERGIESIMVNSNPETVSTDYDISTRLYFEPLTLEHILNICEEENPEGVIVQFGGQTPLNLAVPLYKAGVKILGTSPENIDRAEDREKFDKLLEKLGLKRPKAGTAYSVDEAIKVAQKIGYPLLVRPSYVLGGRAMRIVYTEEELKSFIETAVKVNPEYPILIDKFLEDAIEIDVDAISDGEIVVVAGIMEHIEEAGIHSGDSACILPPLHIPPKLIDEIKEATTLLAKELEVKGLINVQYAIKNNELYVLEVNPRASRTIPFVSKAIGVPLAKLATWIMIGERLKDIGFTKEVIPPYYSVKEVVFPFKRFPQVDVMLGPEMKSTGEVMGIDWDPALAYAKAQLAAGMKLPTEGKVFISIKDEDKPLVVPIAKTLEDLGFKLIATKGTAQFLKSFGIEVTEVPKISEHIRPNILDLLKNKEIALAINTAKGKESKDDAYLIRRYTMELDIPYATTLSCAKAMVESIKTLKVKSFSFTPLQKYYTYLDYKFYKFYKI
ncbi:carbamoyl-phosphate synthase, large subunit [Thermodesulfobacterium geofontis OPF15]|uniref:Carbamoyl phosphate synthase large chain n=1 Tax=Thermodesulfobacterium geofontis (strain OPF15) TaxID=795359 RepID=F8C299_THEGP|nr:carbamoyl-phosphate synthase large subunit [Thermodesulfobacterium geofontis]AEH23357.1 carbamoyl-phosphate synthase, large subunit [Thermodesulfobacterium geofontis OPF15]